MKKITALLLAIVILMTTFEIPVNAGKSFEVGNREFLVDGNPFQIRAAELHYPRIPREYWRHRIRMCKALGMNTICAYVFWNYHESSPGNFDFSGQRNLREFIEIAGQEGMKVILRPGPYVCAEWEMGGLPWWLLKDKDIRLRENDPRFVEAVERFEDALAKELKGLTDPEGGPIIMIQVENEYGSYGIDKEYIGKIRDILRKHYPESALFQCDWSSNFTQNGLDDLLWTLNFGTGADVDKEFAELKSLRPESPLICSEYWSGWFDKWGANHETRPAGDMVRGLEEMIRNGISFSLYMTHGGTNFSHWAGANSPGYAPDVTSYDYDAPISESGRPTEKYFELRDMIQRHSSGPLPEIPDEIPVMCIDSISFNRVAPLFSSLPDSIKSDSIMTMEEIGQGFGSILYRTGIPASASEREIVVDKAHDYALIWLDGIYVGKLDRRYNETALTLPPVSSDAILDILVEATGRINFGRAIKDFKGITGSVSLDGKELNGWEIFPLPDEYGFFSSLPDTVTGETGTYDRAVSSGRMSPGVYRATFDIDYPADTWFDFSSWGKGSVYLNGHGLGRIWETGPQQTLYAPGCWMKSGENELLVFDVKGPRQAVVAGVDTPVYDRVVEELPNKGKGSITSVNLDDKEILAECGPAAGEWEVRRFAPEVTRYVMIETDSSTIINELYLLDENGDRLPREDWRIFHVSSEEKTGNHTADKIIDLQETTYWQPAAGTSGLQRLVIDLGTPRRIAALQVLMTYGSGITLAIPTGL